MLGFASSSMLVRGFQWSTIEIKIINRCVNEVNDMKGHEDDVPTNFFIDGIDPIGNQIIPL